MANAIYPRKGTLTRGNVKTLLGADSIFNSLSDAQKNSVIDISVHKIASLRNKLLKSSKTTRVAKRLPFLLFTHLI